MRKAYMVIRLVRRIREHCELGFNVEAFLVLSLCVVLVISMLAMNKRIREYWVHELVIGAVLIGFFWNLVAGVLFAAIGRFAFSMSNYHAALRWYERSSSVGICQWSPVRVKDWWKDEIDMIHSREREESSRK